MNDDDLLKLPLENRNLLVMLAHQQEEITSLTNENERLRTMVAKMWYTDAPFVTADGTRLLTPEEERLAAEWVVQGWHKADQRETT